ncbi:MAG TPA: tetratricopeptide repeat protein, partial [Isosphaeraceae bacterium]|nr:tetratricopeptide repeat protein [Isosphaeraceae bacterium]
MNLETCRTIEATGSEAEESSSSPAHFKVFRQSGLTARAAVPILVFVATLLPFAPVVWNGFVNWDDTGNFTMNLHYRGLSWSNLRWAWTTLHLGVYQPLFWMLCGLEYQLFGLRPGGYHLVSLLFHGAVSLVFYALVIAIVRRARPDFDPGLARLAGAIAVLSWSVHPLRVEAVAWASCQGYLPCAFFAILSARFYLAAHPPAGPAHFGWIAGALGSYVASLLCHATSLGLPVVLLALDFAVLHRLKSRSDVRRAVLQKWLFLILGAAFTVMAFLGKNSGQGVVSLRSLSPAQRIAAASYAFCFYIVRTVLPFGLHVHRQFPADLAISESRFLISLLAACAVCSAAILQRRSRPWLLAVVAAYLVILSPNSGLLAFGGQIVADRYAYLSMIPWALALSQGLMIMKPRPIRRILLVAVPALTLLGILTWKQCYTWRSSEVLWVHAIEAGETDNAVVLGNLGADLLQQGRVDEADAVLRRSLDLEPNSRVANELGRIFDRRGMSPQSIAAFTEAVELDPHDPEPRVNLARGFVKQNRLPQALEQFAAAVRLRPDSASLRQEYGELLARKGRLEESTVQFRHAVQLEPDVPIGHLFLGRALVELGRRDEAAIALGNAVRLRPDVVGPRFELALLYADLGRTREAMLQLSEVLRLDPRHAAARRAQSR